MSLIKTIKWQVCSFRQVLAYSVQFSSVAQSCPTLCDPMDHRTTGLPVHHQLLEFIQTHIHWVSGGHLICHPTISSSVIPLSSCPQSFRAPGSFQMSQFSSSGGQSIGVSASTSVLSNEYSGLISFRMDWLDLLAVQRTQESSPTPQFKSINSSVLSFLYSPILTSTHDYWKKP